MSITNFGKIWSFTPTNINYPINVEELKAIVKNSKKIRVMGSRHSWSKGIITEDTLISLDKMNQILNINTTTNQATIQAGKTLKDIIKELEIKGFAFSNLGSINAQTLAGAIGTATHGTGIQFQCLASQVESFKLIDADGNEKEYGKNDEHFYAKLTGFGCFGVVYEIVLNIVPNFQMHAITDTTTVDDLFENIDTYVNSCDHFKFWWLPPNDRLIIFKNNRTTKPRNDSDFVRFIKDEFVAVGVYRTLLAIGKKNRQKYIPKINNFLTKEVGKKFERICKSYISFLTPVPPVHRESEWAFDFKNAKELLKSYKQLFLNDEHRYNFVQEVRFTKADNFWLSPAYQRDSMWLTLYNIDTNVNWDAQMIKFQTWAKANGGRPHWGKEATLDADYLKTQYEKIGDFQQLMKANDPTEKFVNKWVEKIFNK